MDVIFKYNNDRILLSEEELSDMYKLKTIVRYNQRQKIKDETVAEHSFFVAMIALKICNKLCLSDTTTYNAVVKALLHDMPEIELNDITYPVKVDLNLYPLLKQYEDKYYEAKFPHQAELMKNDCNNVVNTIVEYADALSVLQYSCNEEQLGNTTFKSVKIEAMNRLRKLDKKLMEAIKNEQHL